MEKETLKILVDFLKEAKSPALITAMVLGGIWGVVKTHGIKDNNIEKKD